PPLLRPRPSQRGPADSPRGAASPDLPPPPPQGWRRHRTPPRLAMARRGWSVPPHARPTLPGRRARRPAPPRVDHSRRTPPEPQPRRRPGPAASPALLPADGARRGSAKQSGALAPVRRTPAMVRRCPESRPVRGRPVLRSVLASFNGRRRAPGAATPPQRGNDDLQPCCEPPRHEEATLNFARDTG